MKYADGTEVKLGERVRVSSGYTGIVVASMDTNEFDSECYAEDWADLKTGILILTDTGALAHFEDPLDSKLFTRELPK
jgi:hypothetical protein